MSASSTSSLTPIRIADPLSQVPDLSGQRAVITGGSSGLGLVTTRVLAEHGAHVLVGVRDIARGEMVRQSLIDQTGITPAQLQVAHLDLFDLESVRAFSEAAITAPVDLLVLNAGISSVALSRNPAGVESQFATNHLGHFALTGHLLDALSRASNARVITVSSALYTRARLDLDDLSARHKYSAGRAYTRSKLANVLFALELGRRLADSGASIRSFAAHPGVARTPLHKTYPSAFTRLATSVIATAIGRAPDAADVGVLAAATSPQAISDRFWGPTGSRTAPDALGAPFAPAARDSQLAARLWTTSQQLTGMRYLY